jgi:hypothetical protein
MPLAKNLLKVVFYVLHMYWMYLENYVYDICVLRDVASMGEWCGRKTNILGDKNCIFMSSANFKILNQIKVNSFLFLIFNFC